MEVHAQSCVPTNLNHTVKTLPCNVNCTSLSFQVPNLKTTDDYVVNTIPYNPFQYIVATGGTEDPNLYNDDKFSTVFDLPFPFCFYNSTYSQAVIGSNGLITFDVTNSGADCAYRIPNTIPYPLGTDPNLDFPRYYPKASIMAVFTDIDPTLEVSVLPWLPPDPVSMPDRKIQWRVEGTAPCRKFIVSYFHIGTFYWDYEDACPITPAYMNTFQMVMYESTGLIDVFIENKNCEPATEPNAILGIQNFARDKGIAAPGKNATPWTAHNEGYRFTPSGATSLFVNSQLLDMSGNVLQTATTSVTTPGILDLNFTNICPAANSQQYVVKTVYNSCPSGTQMISLDTVTVNKTTFPTNASATSAGCTSNATITVTANGVAPYTFLLDGSVTNSTGIFNGIAAGTHSILVTDNTNCTSIATVVVTGTSSITATATPTAASCPGVNNGGITVTSNGTAPITFILDGVTSNTTGIFTGVATGPHSISYSDANGCSGTTAATVAVGPAITGNATPVATSCNNAQNGSITVTSNGVTPVTYVLDGGTTNTTGIFTGVAAGPHTITFTGANGCPGLVSTVIIAGPALTGTATPAPTSCNNATNGSINMVSNGVAPVTYVLDGVTNNTTGIFTTVSAGLHTVTFTDSRGCTGTASTTIVAGPALTANGNPIAASCPGINNGSWTITTNGVAPINFVLDGATTNSTGIFPNLAPGSHTITFTDSRGCTGTITRTVTSGAAITGTATPTAAACPGINNGTITVTSTGVTPVTYVLDGGTTNTTGIFNAVAAGAHTITFTDNNGCTGSASTTVTSGAAITGTATPTATSCNNATDGSITVTSNGATPVTYVLDGGTSNTTGIFTGIAAGPHTITFTAVNGCTGSAAATVTAGPALVANGNPTTAACPGINNATWTVTSNGIAPVTYILDGGTTNTTGAFTNISAGSHTITFTDSRGCTGTITRTVTSGAAITGTATPTATSCNNATDGSITVTCNGATPVTYVLDGGTSNTTGIFTGVAAGPHTITFTAVNGCTGSAAATVNAGPALVANGNPTTAACPGINNASWTVTCNGAAPVTYILDGGTTNTTGAFTNISAGSHTITFTDSKGCTGTITSTVGAGSAITGTASPTAAACPGINNGTITVNSNGTAPITYILDGITTNTTGIFTGVAAGTHTINFTDANGCSGTASATITSGAAITGTATPTATSCNNATDGSITVTSNGATPVTYVLDGGTSNTTGIFTGVAAGPHTITFTAVNGCTGSAAATVTAGSTLIGNAVPVATSCSGVNNGTLTVTSNGTAPVTYILDGLTTNTTGFFSAVSAGSHSITFTDSKGCTGAVTTTVTAGAAITGTATPTSTSCNNATDGTITATSTGVTPVTYTLDGVTSNTTGIFTGVAAGLHTISISDGNGCSATATATVLAGPALTGNAVPVATSCPGISNGSINVISNGTTPVNYTLDGITTNTTGIFTAVADGAHTITFTDSKGCTGTVSTIVGTGSVLTSNATPSPASCPASPNGSITVTSSGTAPVTYILDAVTSNTTGIFTGVSAGSHTINFTDANGCSGSVNTIVTAGPDITGTATPTATSCNNATDGSIIATSNGALPVSFVLDGITTNTTGIFNGLTPGLHTIIFTDANGCSATAAATIIAGNPLNGSATTIATSCPGINNGSITVTSNGAAPVTYILDGITNNPTGIFTSVAAGAHTITFTDNKGCTGTVSATVGSGLPLTSSVNVTPASCPSVADGTATVTSSGTAPVSYTLGTVTNTNGIFSTLSSGTHTINFIDANGCTGSIQAIITSGPAINGSAVFTPASCPSVNNGTITATSNGIVPVTYTLDGTISNTTGIFTGVSAGLHNIVFTDNNGCPGTTSVTVTQGPAITGTATPTATSCNNAMDGSISVTSTGATPVTYLLDGTISNSTGIFTGLAAGLHTISFTDQNGCSGSTSAIIHAGAALTATATTTGTSCPGINNGSIQVNSDGIAPVTYLLDGTITNTTGSFSAVASGTHNITFTDSRGCTGSVNASVAQGSAITGSASATATSCNNATDGTITATSNGVTPVTYILNGTATNITGIFTGVSAGLHTIIFTDGNGCPGTATATITAGPALTGQATSSPTSCPTINNGRITVTSNGMLPVTYQLDGTVTNTTGIFTGVSAGLHTITFTDAKGCTGTTNATVSQGAAITGSATTIATSCPAVNNGSITVTTTGIGTVNFMLDGTVTNTTGIFTGVTAGSHTIMFTDGNGCPGSVSANVAQGPAPQSTLTFTHPMCTANNNGTMIVVPTNGTAPYQFLLDGAHPQNNGNYTGLNAGTHTVSYTDANGCAGSQTATLVYTTNIIATYTTVQPSCFGGNNGSITITATGGTAPYTYALAPSTVYVSNNVLNGLAAGSHIISVKDNFGCTNNITAVLTQPTQLFASAVKVLNETCLANNGKITVTGSGGTAPYTFSLNGSTYNASPDFLVAAGTYNSIKVKDSKGCIASANTVVVGLTNDLIVNAGKDSTICQGTSLEMYPTATPAPAKWEWTASGVPLSTLSNPQIQKPVANPVDTALYTITVTAGPCTKQDVMRVNVLWKPIAYAGPDKFVCQGDSALLIGSATHTSGSVTYAWTPVTGLNTPASAQTYVHPPIGTTEYTLTVKDNYNCNFTATDIVKVTLQPPIHAFAGNDTIAMSNRPHQLNATGGIKYLWSSASSGVTISNPAISNPLATLTADAKFIVRVEDAVGCWARDTIFIKVYEGPAYYVPNAFTPNGDGRNDIFRPIPVGIAETEYFRIFNRYGELVFETNQYLKGWDGTYRGQRQPMGAYVWVIKGKDRNGRLIDMKGSVTLIR
jgi:gliding motility-associated-like protein